MIELLSDQLAFSFPEVHKSARLHIDFQRTLRIPDDDGIYPLPPGLGAFPLRHVDDFADRVPGIWLEHGGAMLPMYQSEAMWLYFNGAWIDGRDTPYPFAIKVAAGKIDAVTGKVWSEGLHRGPQDYMVSPKQPWLDGYCVEKGTIRQFVAMPLGSGYSAEEQITGKAEHGGLQIAVYPMKRQVFERRFPVVVRQAMYPRTYGAKTLTMATLSAGEDLSMDMGLAPGGKMKQQIYEDDFDLADWDLGHGNRCFVHIANSLVWRQITGEEPPHTPPTAKEYQQAGLPWFDYYADGKALEGSEILAKLKSVVKLGQEKGDVPLPENESVTPEKIVHLRQGLGKNQVREGRF